MIGRIQCDRLWIGLHQAEATRIADSRMVSGHRGVHNRRMSRLGA